MIHTYYYTSGDLYEVGVWVPFTDFLYAPHSEAPPSTQWTWHKLSTFETENEAIARVSILNGGTDANR